MVDQDDFSFVVLFHSRDLSSIDFLDVQLTIEEFSYSLSMSIAEGPTFFNESDGDFVRPMAFGSRRKRIFERIRGRGGRLRAALKRMKDKDPKKAFQKLRASLKQKKQASQKLQKKSKAGKDKKMKSKN